MKAIKIISSIVIICSTQFSFGGEETEVLVPSVQLIKSALNPSLKANESVYRFTFSGFENQSTPQSITYNIDGVEYNKPLTIGATIDVKTSPGNHVFSFYLNTDFTKVDTEPLTIQPKFQNDYRIRFMSTAIIREERIIVTCKPVIYLYPEHEMDVEVKLDFKGENPILYPAYNDGWNCKAHSNGDLTVGTETYNYLFWEANQPDHIATTHLNEGFIVEGQNAISFFKDKLTIAGLTSKEQADFITFWGPLIQRNELNFVRFEFNETCDKFTKLNITPSPDQTYRIYIFFSPIDAPFVVKEQEIETINRSGFTVLEWGGQISDPIQTNPSNI